jgi:hypothetical protein
MKKICHPEDLRKALETANLLQHIHDIQGEDQKQLDGSSLPVCEPILKALADQAATAAVFAIFDTQCARDWKSIIEQRRLKEAAADVDNKNDNLVEASKDLDGPAYTVWWDGLSDLQKNRILKRLWKIYIRSRS